MVPPERVEAFLQQLEIDALWGVGPKTAAKLRQHGLSRLVDVRTATDETLRAVVGKHAATLQSLARGLDPRPVQPNREAKSSSSEHTYDTDLVDTDHMRAEIARLAGRQTDWLERRGLYARSVTVKVRFDDFSTVTRTSTAEVGTRDREAITRRALELLARTDAGRRAVRLLGVGVQNFSSMLLAASESAGPLPLFDLPQIGGAAEDLGPEPGSADTRS